MSRNELSSSSRFGNEVEIFSSEVVLSLFSEVDLSKLVLIIGSKSGADEDKISDWE